MTRRTDGTKSAAAKKDRREQNRINQQSFRERKRKEFEELRAELESIKASQVKASDVDSLDRNTNAHIEEHVSQQGIPSDATRFETPAESKVECGAVPTTGFSSDATLDPSLLTLSAPTGIGSSQAPYSLEMLESNHYDTAFDGPPLPSTDSDYTCVPSYDLGSALHRQSSSFGQAYDGVQSATYSMPSHPLHTPYPSLPADPVASITADYMNAQLLAYKSAEWYARAAEVGIKIATTRQNAWLDKTMLWPQWSLHNADRGQSYSGHDGAIDLDYMSTNTSAQVLPPPPTTFPEPWYTMMPQDWQQIPTRAPGVTA